MQQLIIIGASGHGRVVADIALRCGYRKIVFLDDDGSKKKIGEYEIVGTTSCLANYKGEDIAIAIGNAKIREEKIIDCIKVGCKVPILTHPNAVISEDVKIGYGTVVMAGAVINPGTIIGKGCIINTLSSVDHDCIVGDFVHVAVGTHLCGTVQVGNGTWIGAGTTVSNNINICGSCMIGAGAVVIEDIKEEGTYIGVPAKIMSKVNSTGGVLLQATK